MSYLGKTGLNHANIKRWTGTPGVTDSILFSTLGFTPFNEQSCIITVNGVKQHDTSFVLTGTRILFSTNLSVTDEVEIIAILSVGLPLRPSDNSVQRKHLVSDLRNITQDKFSGNASTTAFTLSYAPYSASSVLVFLNGVSQLAGTDYTVSSVTLTFTTPPVTGTDNINVIHLVYATGTAEVIPADNSITAPKLAIGAVTKVYNGSDIKLSSTSTGIDVTGSVTSDGLTVDGAQNTRIATLSDSSEGGHRYLGFTSSSNGQNWDINSQGDSGGVSANLTLSTKGTERMAITSTGNVGIGTTSPETNLMIYSTVTQSPALPGASTTGMFALNGSGQATLSIGKASNNTFWFSNVNRAFTGNNYYNIALNPLGGNVGIGTTAPVGKLTIESNASVNNQFLNFNNTETNNVRNWSMGISDGSLGTFRIYDLTANQERMRIDSSGIVTMPNQPAWRLQPNFTSNSSNSAHYIPFAQTNTHGTFITLATVNSAGRVTVPVTGKYSISACFRAENSVSDSELSIFINGSKLQRGGIWYNPQPYENISISGTFHLSANDYIDIRIEGGIASTGYNGYNDVLTFFHGHLIG